MRHRSTIAKIKAKLWAEGISCAAIDRKYRLYNNQASDALFQPNEAGENAIADILKTTPQQLWPHRFNKKGERLIPQPRSNYRPRKVVSQRQKLKAA